MFDCFCMRFAAPFSEKKADLSEWKKNPGENGTNVDIILLILAKSLDKHGTTLVHITYPSLISVLIFAMYLKIFTHVVGENVFLQFIAVKIPCQIHYRNNNKRNSEEFSRDHPGVRVHLHCFRRHA